MSIEPNNNYNARPSMRSWMHIIAGIMYVIFGFMVIFLKYFNSIQLSKGTAYAMGSLLLLYGIFRLYRGISSIRSDRQEQ